MKKKKGVSRIPAVIKFAIYCKLLVSDTDDDKADAATGDYVCDLARDGDGALLANFLRELADDHCRVPPNVIRFIADVFDGTRPFEPDAYNSNHYLKWHEVRLLLKRVDKQFNSVNNTRTRESLIEEECEREGIESSDVRKYLSLPEYRRLGLTKEEYDIFDRSEVTASNWWQVLQKQKYIKP